MATTVDIKQHVQARHFCFTYNQQNSEGPPHGVLPLPSPSDLISKIRTADPTIDYVKFQEEKAPTTGRLHYQGVFYVGRRRTFGALLRRLQEQLPGIHLERARNWAACLRYVSKTDTHVAGPWEHGDPPSRYPGCGGSDQKITFPPREDPEAERYVCIILGPSGCGKTRGVRERAKELEHGLKALYPVPASARQSSGRWLGSYSGEPIVLFDEFRASEFSRGQWLTMLDRYDIPVPASMGGKSTWWQPEEIYLVTEHKSEVEQLISDPAIARRISNVIDLYQTPTVFIHAHETSQPVLPPTDEEIPDPPG